MFYLKCNPKFFLHIKKNIFLKKSVSYFWIDFISVLSILQKSKVTNNLIMILGYSNDKNIYLDSLYKIWHIQATGFDP